MFTRFFKIIASLKLAVFLLLSLGVIFGAGTFIESSYGAETAQILIYRTQWFSFLLLLLAFNLFASAFDRMPWKKRHTGFLLTHLGIILILTGSLISKRFGVDGQLAIEEGNVGTRITLSEPILQVKSVETGEMWRLDLKKQPFPWSGIQTLKSDRQTPFTIKLLHDFPKAKPSRTIRAASSGPPAIHVALEGSMASVDTWLMLGDPGHDKLELGPALIQFSNNSIVMPKKESGKDWGVLHFDFESGTHAELMLTPEIIGKTVPLKGTNYQIKIEGIFKDARVQENQLVDQSPEWNNPAVKLLFLGKDFSEPHSVFAKFPDFPTVHGLAPSRANVRIAYAAPGFSDDAGRNELRFIDQGEKPLRYQARKGSEIREGVVVLGESVETGWMDFKFTVDQIFSHAAADESFLPLPGISEELGQMPAIQIEFETSREKKVVWLPQGELTLVDFPDAHYHLMYGLKTMPLGFQIFLRDFKMDTNPGTNDPASFKSEVVLRDPGLGIEREVLIEMNHPLKHRGFKVYQAAYQVSQGKPDISVFSVGRDPGNFFKYSGTVVMVGGILLLFYVKPFSTLSASDPKLRRK